MQLPHTVGQAVFAWFQAANVGTSAYPFLTMGNAQPAARPRQPGADRHLRAAELEGRWFGTMALSEPQAGSSLADITTRAEPQDDGTYRLTGNKMWISGGDHELTENIVHLVLAKIPGGPPGVKGISLFIVPKFLVDDDGSLGERNDVVLAGLNHKMGYRGTTNTLLNFGEGVHTPGRAGRRGRLPGRRAAPRPDLHVPHDERGADRRRHGRDRARLHRLPARARVRPHPHAGPAGRRRRTRPRRRCRSSSTPTCAGCCWPRSPTSRAGSRSASTARGWSTRSRPPRPRPTAPARTCCWTCSPRSRRPGRRSGAWSPTTSPSRCTAATATPATTRSSSSTGTTGSTRSTRAPHGIQALDLLGRKVVMQGGAGLALLGETIAATTARAAGTEWAGFAADLDAAVARLGAVTATLWGAGDPEVTLANSHVYLEAAGHLVVAWLWLEQALAAAGAGRATSTRASGRPPGTSGAGSCRGCTTASTCSSRWTGRCWTRRRALALTRRDPGQPNAPPLQRERRGVRAFGLGGGPRPPARRRRAEARSSAPRARARTGRWTACPSR